MKHVLKEPERAARIVMVKDLISKGHKQSSIAKVLGITQPSLSVFMTRHGLDAPSAGRPAKSMLPRTAAMVDRIKPLVEGGMLPTQIAAEVGINVDKVRHILRRYCHRPYLKVRNAACASNARASWGSETADPAILTPEQLDTARRVGIAPERFAWLCSIPKDPNAKRGAIGYRGGNHIG